jgi:alanine racemase
VPLTKKQWQNEIKRNKMRETVLEISLKRLQHNLDVFRQKMHPNTRILANLKGNAYGIGAFEVGKYLAEQQVDYFSIAYINEGVLLRKNGIKVNLLVFNPSFEHFQELIDYQLEPEVSSLSYLNKLIGFLEKNKFKNFPIHIKLDTGMHRAGIMENELDTLIYILQNHACVEVKSVFSHLAAAEDPDEDDFTRHQIALFEKLSSRIKQKTKSNFFRHLLNTAGIFRFPEAQYDMIRPGLGIFGFNLVENDQSALQPIAQLKTGINQIKNLNEGETVGYNRNFSAKENTKVALLPIGYADGISRKLGEKKYFVTVNGQKAPIIGNVSMDTISIDVSHLSCQQGDEVIIFDHYNDVYRMAKLLDTIPYEIITGITRRVIRKIVH